MKPVSYTHLEPDASGRRSPVEIPGSEFTIEVDSVIISIGTSPNPLIKSTTADLEAVSYTHLDVYKRQLLRRMQSCAAS